MLSCRKSKDDKRIYYYKGKRITKEEAQKIEKQKKINLYEICEKNDPISCTKSKNNRDMYFYQGRRISKKRVSELAVKRNRSIPKCLTKGKSEMLWSNNDHSARVVDQEDLEDNGHKDDMIRLDEMKDEVEEKI